MLPRLNQILTTTKKFKMGVKQSRKYDADFKRNALNFTDDPTRNVAEDTVNIDIEVLFLIDGEES